MANARLLPLMTGSAAGSLGPDDLYQIGISAVAVDILELGLGFGWERIERLGGLGTFLGWDGPVVAVASWSTTSPATTGRRAQALPQLLSDRDGMLRLRSAIDGSTMSLGRQEISAWAVRLGAEPDASIAGDGVVLAAWKDGDPPSAPMVVSRLAQEQAHQGRFWDGAGWSELQGATEANEEPLRQGCSCRACAIASRLYLAHLWSVREITAEHLLGWHNLHQARLRVEDTAG